MRQFHFQVPHNFGKDQGASITKPHLPIHLPKIIPIISAEPKPLPRPVQVIVNFTQYCPPTRSRGLFWNLTKAVRYTRNIEIYTLKHRKCKTLSFERSKQFLCIANRVTKRF